MGGACYAAAQSVEGLCRHALHISDHGQTHIVLYQVGRLALYGNANEMHQGVHLLFGAVPVFSRKSIEREVFHPHPRCYFSYAAHGVDTLNMSLRAVKAAGLGPTSVAIHDYRHMRRYLSGGRFAGFVHHRSIHIMASGTPLAKFISQRE